MSFTYPAMVAWDDAVDRPSYGATALVYALDDTTFATPLPILGDDGAPLAQLAAGSVGVFPRFTQADNDVVRIRDSSGANVWTVVSIEGHAAAADDAGVADLVQDPTSQTRQALSATYATKEESASKDYANTLAYGTDLDATDLVVASWVADPVTETGAAVAAEIASSIDERDTKWRNITSLLTQGWTADSVLIRRVGPNVYIKFYNLSDASATARYLLVIPNGFRSPSTELMNPQKMYHNVNAILFIPETYIPPASPTFGHLETWITDDAFPSTLPGTPA